MRAWLVLAAGMLVAGTVWAAADKGPKTGKVKVATPGLIVRLKVPEDKTYGKGKAMKNQGDREGIPLPCGKEVTMPEGKYEVSSVTLSEEAKDDNGAAVTWSMTADGGLGRLHDFTVRADEVVVLEGGGPFKVKTDFRFHPNTDDLRHDNMDAILTEGVTVKVRYVGKSGEEYNPRLMKGRNMAATAPQVRFWDEGGTLVTSYGYVFGNEKVSGWSKGMRTPEGVFWKRPGTFKGKFRAEVVPYAGPFEMEKQAEDNWQEWPVPAK